jgi:hypothetical protein
MPKDLLITSIGLALFIVCPRMAGMVYIIARNSQASLVYTALFGSIVAIPLVIAMVWVFAKFGLWGALAFCILTDLGSAFVMKEISFKAGLETLVVALFVIVGVKAAPFITGIFLK